MNQKTKITTALELYPNYTGTVDTWDGSSGTISIDTFNIPVRFGIGSLEGDEDIEKISQGVKVIFKILGDAGGTLVAKYESSTKQVIAAAFAVSPVQNFLG